MTAAVFCCAHWLVAEETAPADWLQELVPRGAADPLPVLAASLLVCPDRLLLLELASAPFDSALPPLEEA
jgi:hypothetical protein